LTKMGRVPFFMLTARVAEAAPLQECPPPDVPPRIAFLLSVFCATCRLQEGIYGLFTSLLDVPPSSPFPTTGHVPIVPPSTLVLASPTPPSTIRHFLLLLRGVHFGAHFALPGLGRHSCQWSDPPSNQAFASASSQAFARSKEPLFPHPHLLPPPLWTKGRLAPVGADRLLIPPSLGPLEKRD